MNEGDLFDDLPASPAEAPAPRRSDAAAADPEPAVEPTVEPAGSEPAEDIPVAAEIPAEPEPTVESEPAAPEQRSTPLPRAGSLGQVLAALRRDCGMDIETVANETRIKASYLEALENDDFSDLPPMVYTLAYVKKLCGVYNISAADADELMEGLREQLAYEIPEDIDKSVICREQDEETRRKLQQISIALIAGAALLILLLVLGGATLILRSTARRDAERSAGEPHAIEEQLAEDRLEWYRQQPQLKTTRVDLVPRREKNKAK